VFIHRLLFTCRVIVSFWIGFSPVCCGGHIKYVMDLAEQTLIYVVVLEVMAKLVILYSLYVILICVT